MTPQQYIKASCAEYRCTIKEFYDSSIRGGGVVKARKKVAKYLRYERQLTLPRIGQIMRRHHTSVMNLLDLIKK